MTTPHDKDCGCQGEGNLNKASWRGFRVDVQGRRIQRKRTDCGCPGAAGEARGPESSAQPALAQQPEEARYAPPDGGEGAPQLATPLPAPPPPEPVLAPPAARRRLIPIGARPSVTPREDLPRRLSPAIAFDETAPVGLQQCARELRSNPPYVKPRQDARQVEAEWLTACARRKGVTLDGHPVLVLPNGHVRAADTVPRYGMPPLYAGMPPPPFLHPLPVPPVPLEEGRYRALPIGPPSTWAPGMEGEGGMAHHHGIPSMQEPIYLPTEDAAPGNGAS